MLKVVSRASSPGSSNGAVYSTNNMTSEPSKPVGEINLPVTEDQFPFKLHKLLEDAESQGFTDAITWSSDGKSFLVLNKHKLEDIMPRYFSSAKFKSFQRSLNLWGFACEKRQYRGPGTRRHHPFFIRDHSELCHGMQRTRVKQPGTRRSLPGTEDSTTSLSVPHHGTAPRPSLVAIKNSRKSLQGRKKNDKNKETSSSSISSSSFPSHVAVPPAMNSNNTLGGMCAQNPSLHAALVSASDLEAFARSHAFLVAIQQQQQQNTFMHVQELAALKMHAALWNGGAGQQFQQQVPPPSSSATLATPSLQTLVATRRKEEELLIQHLLAARARSNLQTALQQQLLSSTAGAAIGPR